MEEEIIVIESEEETEIVVIENDVEFIKPITQEITITPSFEEIIKTPDENYTGFSKVTVTSIPEEYIIPSGEINIVENGSYDVVEKAVANINVPEKLLGTKVIDKNGTYNALDDKLDGYSSVEVSTSGVDINDYFNPSSLTTYYISAIKKIPSITLAYTSMNGFVQNFKALEEFPFIDTSNVINMASAFRECASLPTIPLLDTGKVTDFSYTFYNCSKLTEVPLLNTQSAKNMSNMFYNCEALEHIPKFDTSNVTNTTYFAKGCKNLTTVAELDLSKVTSINTMFRDCSNLPELGNLNTHSCTDIRDFCYGCTKLTKIGVVECEKVVSMTTSAFTNCANITELGGFNNYGQAFLTTVGANYGSYTLYLVVPNKLTEQALINVLNGLYDIASNGCKTQKCTLGATNLEKLTSEAGMEALANAQAKGWTIS